MSKRTCRDIKDRVTLSSVLLFLILGTTSCGPGVFLGESTTPEEEESIEGLIMLYLFDDEGTIANGATIPAFESLFSATADNGGSGMEYLEGKYNQAISFDGVDDLINLSTRDEITNLQDFSISVWLRPESLGDTNTGRIADKIDSTGQGWMFTMSPNNAIRFIRTSSSGGSGVSKVTSANVITLFEWNHVVLTTSADLQAENTKFYINNVLVGASVANSGVLPVDPDAGNELTVGDNISKFRSYAGRMDELAIFNRVLTEEEVGILFSKSAAEIEFDINSLTRL